MNWYKKAQLNVQQKEWIEYQITLFIENKFDQAIELFKQDMKAGNRQKFLQYLRQTWTPSKGVDFFLPGNQFPEDIAKYPIKMQYGNNEAYFINGVYTGMKLNPYGFDQVTDISQIDQVRSSLFQGIAHETEHIYNEGTDPEAEGGGVEGAIRYMLKHGEIQAHARQLAYTYIQNYPQDKAIDINNLNQLISNMNNTFDNYVNKFSDPVKQTQYQQIGDIKTGHQQFMNALNKYFNQYKTQQNTM